VAARMLCHARIPISSHHKYHCGISSTTAAVVAVILLCGLTTRKHSIRIVLAKKQLRIFSLLFPSGSVDRSALI
jgi:hypothetical protein